MEEIKIQQNDLKKTYTPSNPIPKQLLKQAIDESQDFINKEFELCKVKQGKIEERAKAAETKIIHMKAEIYSLQETLHEEQSKVNDLKQYGRRNMVEINNIPFKTDENLEAVITDIARKGMKLDPFNYKQHVDVAQTQ